MWVEPMASKMVGLRAYSMVDKLVARMEQLMVASMVA